ncbi:MAG TPA: hypothetical protein VFQ53_21235 [Kofleriaceae bacterium]|nr:hypothetical protein [Kofleriaceae bacterium]
MRAAVAAVVALAGCHVVERTETLRPHLTQQLVDEAHARDAGAATIVLATDGHLRFVQPRACPSTNVRRQHRVIELETRPNIATFVVGMIATSIGGILIVRGAADGTGLYTVAGLGLVAGGGPLAIAPWVGNGTTRTKDGERTLREAGPEVACGDRALAAGRATLQVGGLEVRGTIDDRGVFEVPVFDLVDVFEQPRPLAIRATLDAGGAIDAVIDGPDALETRRALRERWRQPKQTAQSGAPDLRPGPLRASLTATANGPAVRVVLRLANLGTGSAWDVRGAIVAPGTPAIDGRMLYAGTLAAREQRDLEVRIPVTDAVAATLRNATIALSIELRDAEHAAPTTPIQLRGPILVDAPR